MKHCVASIVLLVALLLQPVAAGDDVAVTFTYTDPAATSVGVAGEFSNWTILPMEKGADAKWTKTLHLKPGYYGYKFVINGNDWVFDPANPLRKMVNDIENSAISVGGVSAPAGSGLATATFTYVNPQAKSVHVAGEFNNWLDASEGKITAKPEWALSNDGAGNWKLVKQLRPGKYQFKYVLDGGGTPAQWVTAAGLPISAEGNSILELVAAAPQPAPAAPAEKGAYFFYAGDAKSVTLAGEFNQWSTTSHPLRKNQFGVWEITVPLPPGRHPYKFVVDGNWVADPTNPEKTEDGHGGFNSVKVVE